jgi:hypothetical protein
MWKRFFFFFFSSISTPLWSMASGEYALKPAMLCLQMIQRAEKGHKIPKHLLKAIAMAESGRLVQGGKRLPWPWTINAEGKSLFFKTKAEAIQAVKRLQVRGVKLIDVGVMQINLHHHPDAFQSLEDAFDPSHNTDYAARFLKRLSRETRKGWRGAVAHYHSTNPRFHTPYRHNVFKLWNAAYSQEAHERASSNRIFLKASMTPESTPDTTIVVRVPPFSANHFACPSFIQPASLPQIERVQPLRSAPAARPTEIRQTISTMPKAPIKPLFLRPVYRVPPLRPMRS